MRGGVAALALAVGWVAVGPAAAQRPDPAALLLPPVASSAPIPPRPADPPAPRDRPAARLGPLKDITPASAQVVEEVRRADRAAERPAGDGLFDHSPRPASDRERESDKWGDRVKDAIGPEARQGWFHSDRAFDCVVSPITNPFLFEDPRALTEIRPLFIYQKIPGGQSNFGGGDIWYLGTQARLAFGERFSLTLNKIGGIAVDANSPVYGKHFGFSELWFGPKVTVIRDPEFATLLAAGAQVHLPIGSEDVYQDTGTLSIVPYVSFSQRFLATRLGTFNGMATAGYSFSTNGQRSDYFYLSGHLSFDVGNAHRFYPILEANWFQYTTDGSSRFIAGEGRDLVNFGSLAKGSSLVTGAVGGRVKLTRSTELGAAFELPLMGNRDFFQYRFTVDFIWRY